MFPQFVRRSGSLSAGLCAAGIVAVWLIMPLLPIGGDSSVFAFQVPHEGEEEVVHEGAAADDHGADHGAGHDSGPPLDFKTDLALWSAVTFVVFLVVLRAAAWKPLTGGLAARERRIRNDLDEAATARREAEKLLAEHSAQISKTKDEIAELLAEARRDSDALKQDILSSAQKDAEATRLRALEEINRARDAAVKDLFDRTSRAVIDATQQILGRVLNESDQDRLVEEALSQFAARNDSARNN